MPDLTPFLIFFSDTLVWLMLGLLVVFLISVVTATILLIPFIPTPASVVRDMIRMANFKGKEKVYDLGCGDARILIEAKRQYPGIQGIGYELSLGAWLLAKLKVLFAGFARKNIPGGPIKVHIRDLQQADLRDADVIFLYLMPTVMPALAKKIEKEVKPGTRVISHDFEFPDKVPIRMEHCTLSQWYFLRRMKKTGTRVFMYEW